MITSDMITDDGNSGTVDVVFGEELVVVAGVCDGAEVGADVGFEAEVGTAVGATVGTGVVVGGGVGVGLVVIETEQGLIIAGSKVNPTL
ncbi:MAG TPA: hypothetical protein VLU95_02355 [Candidatus Acidoferrum sp.]|nr:hypothetical protein [Candidatus Acidoferrum sp.]